MIPKDLPPSASGMPNSENMFSKANKNPTSLPRVLSVPTPIDSSKNVLRRISSNEQITLKLSQEAKKIQATNPVEAMLPKTGLDSDVYISELTVFKPDPLGEATKRAILCDNVAEILGLDQSVPKTIEATAAFAMSQKDMDDQGCPIAYTEALIDEKPALIDLKNSFEIVYEIHKKDGTEVRLSDGSKFFLVKTADGYEVKEIEESDSESEGIDEIKNREASDTSASDVEFEPSPLGDNEDDGPWVSDDEQDHTSVEEDSRNVIPLQEGESVVVATFEDRNYLVRQESAHPVTIENNSPLVVREGTRFELRQSLDGKDSKTLLGKDVQGLLQQKVQNAFSDLNINISKSKKAIIDFFEKIDGTSFVDSVLLAVLFRTQDGRASDLGESNFLFTEDPLTQKYTITLIDFDETWPTSNDFQGRGRTAALRLGLMGFPLAHKVLEGDEKTHLLELLKTLIEKKTTLLETVDTSVASLKDGEKVKTAFEEVLLRLSSFYETRKNTEFTLADMVFHVFPVYKKQWDDGMKMMEADSGVSLQEAKAYKVLSEEEKAATEQWEKSAKIRMLAELIGFATEPEISKSIQSHARFRPLGH